MVSKSGGMVIALIAFAVLQTDSKAVVAERVMKLTRDAVWKPVTSIRVDFSTYHPQGMVKIGDTFYVTSVEIKVPTTRFPKPVNGYDRDPGQGIGHLFQIDRNGKLMSDLPLGEGTMYHPGGIDYDGTNIWIPVAEYRPDSRSIIYRVDPARMQAAEVFRFADHIGAIVHNTDDNTLHGVSWGSRRFYRWTLDKQGKVTNADVPPDRLRVMNVSHYVDYQDCKYVSGRRMLCSGVTELRQRPEAAPFRLGGLELIDLSGGRPLHQVPVLLWTADGVDMMHNPVWIEPVSTGLRGYFMPEDNTSTIYIYDVDVK
jgi:Family of unknown function (DUF6454)